MPLGRPAINDPRALELRALIGSIGNIRQRIEAIEAAVAAGTGTAAGTPSAASSVQLAFLRAAVTTIEGRLVALESAEGVGDPDSSGSDVELFASEAVAVNVPVVATGATTCAPVDPNDPNAMFAVIGVSIGSAVVGAPVTIRRWGALEGIAGAGFEIGRAVYAGDLGLTQTPDYESTAIPIGVAVSATAIWIAPGWPALSAVPFASAVGDEFLRYLPVTYRIVQDAVELLEAFNAQPNGILVKTDANTVASRALIASSGDGITIENADGVDDDPLFHVPSSEARRGSATLIGGAVTVPDTQVTVGSLVFLTNQDGAGPVGALYVSARVPGVSFTISSTNALDVSLVGYEVSE